MLMAMIFGKRKERCVNCKFHVFGYEDCHALPPVVHFVQSTTADGKGSNTTTKIDSVWPQVKPDDWCGLYKAAKEHNNPTVKTGRRKV
jgi:hypothetical protein